MRATPSRRVVTCLVVSKPWERSPSLASWRQLLRFLLGAIVGTAAIWFALSAAGGPSTAVEALERTHPWWLVPAVLTQVLAFLAAAVRLRVLTAPTVRLGMAVAMGLELTMNGLWSMAPAAPAEGLTYGAHQLHRRGLDRTRTALVLGLEQWFTYWIFYFIASLNLLFILGSRDFPVSGPWPPIAAVIVLVALAATARLARTPASMEHLSRAVSLVRFWVPRPTAAQRRDNALVLHATAMDVVGKPSKRVRLVLLSLIGHLSGVMTLIYSMRAVGLVVDFPLGLLATAAAVVASSIPLLPGGIGMVEATVPALLHWYGAPLDQALAGAVVMRVINTLLPAISGAVALWALSGVPQSHARPVFERD